MTTLSLAAKAPLIDYASLVASAFVNTGTDNEISLDFQDVKDLEKGITVSVSKDEKVVASNIDNVLNFLPKNTLKLSLVRRRLKNGSSLPRMSLL